MTKRALYLAGGGARGAYQAGVLKAICHILDSKTLPFDMITGVSIGSMNAAVIAQHADDFRMGVERLETLWKQVHCHHIFNTSNFELGKSVFRNLGNIFVKQEKSGFLLETSPLHQFISSNVDFDKIRQNIKDGHLDTLEIISNCYETHKTVSFYEHNDSPFDSWDYARHSSQATKLGMQHILASGSLPLFFPPVNIDGLHYGDGSMGLVSPMRATLRSKIERVLIVGTRASADTQEDEQLHNGDIGFAHVLGHMLNNLFVDNLDRDIEMVNRMNEIARLLSLWKKRQSPWRPMQTLYLRPTLDLSYMAQEQYQSMPALLRFLLNILGAKSHSGDLLSFLLFEGPYTEPLIELGYHDTLDLADEIRAFFN